MLYLKLVFCTYYLVKYFLLQYKLRRQIYVYRMRKQGKGLTWFQTYVYHSILKEP